MNDDEQHSEGMRFVGDEPIAKVYDTQANPDGEDVLIAKVYQREAAAELADAWWTRVEYVNEGEQSRTDAHNAEQTDKQNPDTLNGKLRAAHVAGAHADFVAFVGDHPDSRVAGTLDTAITLDALDDFAGVAGSFAGSLWESGVESCGNPDEKNAERIRETFDRERWPSVVKAGEQQ